MKVYVIFEQISYDYEGTACQNIGVFGSYDEAFERVRKDIPKAEHGGYEFYHPEKNGDEHTWSIETWDVTVSE